MIPSSSVVISLYILLKVIRKKTYSSILYLWVFFVPFTATAFINIQYNGASKSLSIVHAIAMLIIFLFFLQIKRINTKNIKYFFILGLLNVLIIISLLINIVSPVDFPVFSAIYSMKDNLINTSITVRNFLNFMYFIIGALMFLVLIEKVKTEEVFLRLVRIFILSVSFMSVWGIMQGITFYLGIDYPSYIFNTSSNINALGYTGTVGPFKRISSFAVEPSIMSQTVLTGLALLMYFNQSGIQLFKPTITRLLMVLMFFILLISTSFLAYIGLIFLFFIYIYRNKLLLIGISVLSILSIIILFPLIKVKLQSYSILERLNSIDQGLQYYFHCPIFGLGFASITSHDLIVNLLVNTGLFGFIVFIIYLFMIFKEHNTCAYNVMKKVLLLLLVLQVLTGFTYVYFLFWFILGLTVLSSRVYLYTGVKE